MEEVLHLTNLMKDLKECFDNETEFLKDGRIRDIGQLYERKESLFAQYNTLSSDLIDTGRLRELDADVRKGLLDQTTVLKKSITENEAALAIAEEAHQKLMKIFLDAIKTIQEPACYYDLQGRSNHTEARTTSVAVNKKL